MNSFVGIIYSFVKSINLLIINYFFIEFLYILFLLYKCLREELCIGGLDFFCVIGYIKVCYVRCVVLVIINSCSYVNCV